MVKEDIVVRLTTSGFKEFMAVMKQIRAAMRTVNVKTRASYKAMSEVGNSVLRNQKQLASSSRLMGERYAQLDNSMKRNIKMGHKAQALLHGTAQGFVDNASVINKVGKGYNTFGKVMNMPLTNWRKFNMEGGEFDTVGAKAANRFRMLTHGLRGFRMEMLGVMFFGMGMTKFFSGLLRPAAQSLGIIQLWTETLSILFLPILMALFPYLLQIMDWFINLPPSAQLAIGTFVLVAAILGKVIFVIGMMALGLGSLAQAFGSTGVLGKLFSGIIGAISIPFGFLLAILAIVAIAVIGFVTAWKENFGNIKEWVMIMWEGVKQFFEGIKQILSGIAKILIGLFTGNMPKIKEGAKQLWEGVKNVFWGFIKFIGGFVVTLGLSLFRAFLGLVVSLTELLGEAFGVMWEKVLTPIGSFFKKWVINPIKTAFVAVINWIMDRINNLIWLINKLPGVNIGEIGHIGTKQFGGVIPKTGVYHLHAGETVTPSTFGGTITFAPTINIAATSTADVTTIRDALSNEWVDELERRMARR